MSEGEREEKVTVRRETETDGEEEEDGLVRGSGRNIPHDKDNLSPPTHTHTRL